MGIVGQIRECGCDDELICHVCSPEEYDNEFIEKVSKDQNGKN